MEVRCEKCQARYRVDDARIGPQGLTMRCGISVDRANKFRRSAAPLVEKFPPEIRTRREFLRVHARRKQHDWHAAEQGRE